MNKIKTYILALFCIFNVNNIYSQNKNNVQSLINIATRIEQKQTNDSIDVAIDYAKQALKQVDATKQEYSDVCILLGKLYFKKNKYDLSIKYLQMAKIFYHSDVDETEYIDHINYFIAKSYLEKDRVDSTLAYINKIIINNNYKKYNWALDFLTLKGVSYFRLSNLDEAELAYEEAVELSPNDSPEQASSYNRLSSITTRMGKYNNSIKYLKKALEIQLKHNDSLGVAESYYGLGSIHYFVEEYDITLNYFKKSLDIFIKNHSENDQARLNNNVGSVYNQIGNYKEALKYFKLAYTQYEKLNKQYALAIVSDNVGLAYQGLGDFTTAERYYKQSFVTQKKIGNIQGEINALMNIAGLYKEKKQLNTAHAKYLEVLKRAQAKNLINEQIDIYKSLVELQKEMGLYQKALESYKNYISIKDTMFTLSNKEQLNQLQTEFDVREQKSKIQLLNAENKLKEAQINKQKTVTISFVIIAILMLILLIFSAFALKASKKAKAILQDKNEKINRQNKQITDSINYARQIQYALFKTSDQIENSFENSFVIAQAKDIVSGDFWWLKTINNKQYLVVADCTGHGVPGGFMSVLGITMMNHIIQEGNNLEVNKIIDELRTSIKTLLVQEDIYGNFDSIDLMLCAIDKETLQMEYAGAYNYTYILRNNEIIELRGDKMPISFSVIEKPFTKKEVQLLPNDRIFMLSDGYVDQFNTEDKKISRKQFKNLLINSADLTIKEQGKFLESFFNKWKESEEQTDDMLVVGVEV